MGGDLEDPGTPRKKGTPSKGKSLVGDSGWLGPFNRMVWAYPNSLLYILLVMGAVAFGLLKKSGYKTNAVSRVSVALSHFLFCV
jgi:hypothetical protein